MVLGRGAKKKLEQLNFFRIFRKVDPSSYMHEAMGWPFLWVVLMLSTQSVLDELSVQCSPELPLFQ